ncbi:MAG TPA: peptidase [Beijerinckiaceae bacterium]|nr:peptidase [Beijerinckiaceae bacterium]
MTYCVGVLVQDGLLMVADTRTNAGLDNIATFRKLHLFEQPGQKMIALATAGNLGVTQAVISLLREGFRNPDTDVVETLLDQPSMFRAAQFVGHAIRAVGATDGAALERSGASFDVTMLLGGQFGEARARLFMLYKAGNFIEATSDTPYLQIGEHKYGKPILDRAVTFRSDLYDALKLSLISMDSTMRSNLGVGLPIDLVVLRKDVLQWEVSRRIEAAEPYFHDLRERWSAALRKAHNDIPPPPYRD